MEFKFQDILKNIIPGSVLLIGLCAYFFGRIPHLESIKTLGELKEYSEIILLITVIGSYYLGYLNDGLSSWFEHYCIYSLFGTPSLKLLRSKGKRIFLVNADEILEHLKTQKQLGADAVKIGDGRNFFFKSFWTSKSRTIILFKHANVLKDSNTNDALKEKTKEYYNSYIFSRNIFFGTLFTFILMILKFYDIFSITAWILMSLIVIVLFIRRRDKSYYYSRHILLACKY